MHIALLLANDVSQKVRENVPEFGSGLDEMFTVLLKNRNDRHPVFVLAEFSVFNASRS